MSHTSSITSIKIVNEEAIKKAVEELIASGVKVSLIANDTPRAYFPNQAGLGKADYVLKLADSPYDVGLYKLPDGSFDVRTDFWAGHVEKVLGAPEVKPVTNQSRLGKFFQSYAVNAAQLQARAKGYSTRRVAGENGVMKLVITTN